jgi:hypothetical protein
MNPRWFSAAALLLVLAAAGCGERNRPVFQKTVAVRGKVVRADGTPVGGGQIELHPASPEIPEARAEINKDGTFVVGTYKVNDGAVPGAYTATVNDLVYDRQGNLRRNPALRVPRRYADARSSGLRIEVRPEDTDLKIRIQ